MRVNTLEDYQIRIASAEDNEEIIELLKETALWILSQAINQWQYLLDGGEDKEIKEAVYEKKTR
ncbi:hypothetical protein [Cytobacillus sp. NCCP-133]|uniref:hypothetical protein n=1 Tax=Cytobacillus sp. NCCP-133 TaxID=766848 RepID=UPI002231354B|nr:hypothetical protein [Cytobacillus sp. NCCP-133]GLB59534.1 hypothetical protein NCCP133_16670 [Cytobacillus sp. NCCP-133]